MKYQNPSANNPKISGESCDDSKYLKVSFQGERGAYSEEAILQHYGVKTSPVPKPYLGDVFNSVEAGEVDLGLVPIENSLEGSILRTYDLLYERDLSPYGEVILRVVHCLITNHGTNIGDIEKVYSHPQALGQCRVYLEDHGYEAIAEYDTAGSVRMIKKKGLKNAGAIASRRAAEVYDMKIIEQGIEAHDENFTRFLILSRDEHPPTGRDKTSVFFILEDKPGTLYRALEVFAENGVNLTKIESRPIIGKPWEYIFFIDILGHIEDSIIRYSLIQLKDRSQNIKLLGSYPRA